MSVVLKWPREGWTPENWCFQIVVLEKTLESTLDWKEIKPVNTKRSQPWIFIGKTDAEAEDPVFWPSDSMSQLTGKDPDAGKGWRQKDKRVTEDELVGWHHQLMNLGKFWEMVRDREAWYAAVNGVMKCWTLLGDWTTTTWNKKKWYRWTYLQGMNRVVDVEKRYLDTEREWSVVVL